MVADRYGVTVDWPAGHSWRNWRKCTTMLLCAQQTTQEVTQD